MIEQNNLGHRVETTPKVCHDLSKIDKSVHDEIQFLMNFGGMNIYSVCGVTLGRCMILYLVDKIQTSFS